MKLKPVGNRAKYDLANLHLSMGRKTEAIREYRAVIAEMPRHADALNNLAWLLASDPAASPDQIAEALALAQRAVDDIEKPTARQLDTLALAQAAHGNFKAAEATADSINTMKLKEKARQAQMAAERAQAEEYAKKLGEVTVTIKAKAGQGGKLFGAVTSQEISDALKAQHGIEIEKNKIVQAEPIKGYGSFTVKAKLGYEVTGNINVMVIEAK